MSIIERTIIYVVHTTQNCPIVVMERYGSLCAHLVAEILNLFHSQPRAGCIVNKIAY